MRSILGSSSDRISSSKRTLGILDSKAAYGLEIRTPPAIEISEFQVRRFELGCAFEDRGEPLTAADAHGLQPIARAPPLQLTRHGGEDAHAGRADRMPE